MRSIAALWSNRYAWDRAMTVITHRQSRCHTSPKRTLNPKAHTIPTRYVARSLRIAGGGQVSSRHFNPKRQRGLRFPGR